MKLCKDCKHFEERHAPATYYFCRASAREHIDLVTGARHKSPMSHCADMRYRGACGKDGNLFEEKAK